MEIGAGKESRTLDLNLGKVALYQLSYSRMGDYRESLPYTFVKATFLHSFDFNVWQAQNYSTEI